MRLIVGLGNPGRRYESTPHNVGFEIVDVLARRHGMTFRQARKIDAQWADGSIRGVRCALLKPTTYMNESGMAVGPLTRGEKMDVENELLVVLDDVAIGLGRLRLRPGGSSGSHNGLDSVIRHMGTNRFPRLRVGVGPTEGQRIEDLARYVLARWPKGLLSEVERMREKAADAAEDWLTGDVQDVMTRYNKAEEGS